MLWCELHNSSGVKGGITNFDPAEYEKDLSWLQVVNQVSSSQVCQTLRKVHKRLLASRLYTIYTRCMRQGDQGYSCMNCLALCRTNW